MRERDYLKKKFIKYVKIIIIITYYILKIFYYLYYI